MHYTIHHLQTGISAFTEGYLNVDSGNSRLITLARETTYLVIDSSGHVALSGPAESLGLQRQVTKCW